MDCLCASFLAPELRELVGVDTSITALSTHGPGAGSSIVTDPGTCTHGLEGPFPQDQVSALAADLDVRVLSRIF